MHVLIEHSSSELYGSDRSLLTIARTLSSLGNRVTVLLPTSGPLADRLDHAGAEVHFAPLAVLRREVLRSPRAAIRLARAYLRTSESVRDVGLTKPDVVMSNTTAMIAGRRLARHFGVPHVQMVREIFGSESERALFSRLISKSQYAIYVSAAARDQFRKQPDVPCEVITSGADLSFCTYTERAHSGRPVRLVCVGRLNSWKGQDTLIRAAAKLKEAGVAVNIRIVGGEYGGGSEAQKSLSDYADELGVRSLIEFAGEVADATPHYVWSDVSITPSKKAEPFGKVVIEAMNASRPVVASAAGGPSEVLADGRGGRLFAPDDEEALANAVLELSDPEVWDRTSREAFEKSQGYSAAASATRIAQALTQLGARS
ncbi:glycosyltransferase family 4 protein [Microbacterium sp. NPDC077184]|uniref:glycosyltransferase family 4 protein n=1 Tax=Microbacterium sp. NPDC077184 TaxID=3154764 RepID=UPI003413CC14